MSATPDALFVLQDEVQRLIDKVLVLEEKVQFLQPDEDSRKAYVLAIEGQAKHIKALEAGACRFHCRTAKENWCAGYVAALNQCEPGSLTPDMTYGEEAEDEWKRLKASSNKDD